MRHPRKGTTLIEVLMVIFLITILAVVTIANLLGKRSRTELDNTASQIASLLREARSKSMLQASSTSWGVHFENATTSFYSIFSSTTYATSVERGHYVLPSSVIYVSSTVSQGGSKDITFAQITGLSSVSTTVTFRLQRDPSSTITISIASSGVVGY